MGRFALRAVLIAAAVVAGALWVARQAAAPDANATSEALRVERESIQSDLLRAQEAAAEDAERQRDRETLDKLHQFVPEGERPRPREQAWDDRPRGHERSERRLLEAR
jgi:hypothetical protein